jgi:Flp pilus assembly protein TadG
MKLRRTDSERGQSLVEFGLVIPIVLLIMLGVFDLGRIVFINNSLSDGARDGARHAATRPRDADYCARVDDAVRSATRGQPLTPYTVTYSALDELGNVRATYLMCQNGADGAGKPGMAADELAAPGDRVTVDIGANVDLILNFIVRATGRDNFSLEAESTMQVTFAP